MSDRFGPDQYPPRDPRDREPESGPAPSGFSFPGDDQGGGQQPQSPNFSVPEYGQAPDSPYGQPASPPPGVYGQQSGDPGQYGAQQPGPGQPPYGSQPPQYNQPPQHSQPEQYNQPDPYGQQPQYGQPPQPAQYDQPGYGPGPGYGGQSAPTSGYGAPGYGQPTSGASFDPTAPTSGYGPPTSGGAFDPTAPTSGYGQPAYGQQPYGQQAGGYGAPPPGYGAAKPGGYPDPLGVPPRAPQDPMALASMITGIASVVITLFGCCCLPILFEPIAIVAGIIAVVLGFLSRKRIVESGGTARGKEMAVAGMSTGGVAVVLGILFVVFFVVFGVANVLSSR